MAPFIYFIPGPYSDDRIEDLGLDDRLVDGLNVPVHRNDVCSADNLFGKTGTLIWQGESRVPYQPDDQAWREHPTEDYWVGYDLGDPPGPEDCMRGSEMDLVGRPVPLGDGNTWMVPVALDADGECPLPRTYDVDDETGEIVHRPQRKYDDIRKTAAELADLARNNRELPEEKAATVSVDALKINYRLELLECCMLELLSDEAVMGICFTLIDWINWPDTTEALNDMEE